MSGIAAVQMEVARAQMSRSHFVACLEDGLTASPLRLMAQATQDPDLLAYADRLSEQQHATIATFKFKKRRSPDGSESLEIEFGVSSKTGLAGILAKVQGFGPEKGANNDEDIARSIAAKIRPTLGLHGEETMTEESPA